MRKRSVLAVSLLLLLSLGFKQSHSPQPLDDLQIVSIEASTKEERSAIISLGISIEEIYPNYVVGFGRDEQIQELKKGNFKFLARTMPAFLLDFPEKDSAFHNLTELNTELTELAEKYSNIATLTSIGKSVEKRDLFTMKISGPNSKAGEKSGIIFMGTHHAREHLSTEVPLFLIKHLLENYGKDANVTKLINNREIWIMPLVNPDGADYDIKDGSYKWWRKNRQSQGSSAAYGVDLNRNYGYQWGGEGAGTSPSSETYRGPKAFSEPETQAVKAFIESHPNITTLLTYHTFSELILYPWGFTYDAIKDERAMKVHEKMAQAMAKMTGYTPQQSSDLYITSGDTTDWSFGEFGIISFTFELYPSSIWEGGFYPGAEHIQNVVKNNIPAALYLIEYADNPYRVLSTFTPTDYLTIKRFGMPRP